MKMNAEQYHERYNEIINSNVSYTKRQEAENELWHEFIEGVEVGDHMNVRLWTDVDPCTVIKRTAQSITVRYDKAELDPDWKPDFEVGGFSAICTNDRDQKWIITEDVNGRTETFRMTRKGWYHDGLICTPGWRKYYDYNF